MAGVNLVQFLTLVSLSPIVWTLQPPVSKLSQRFYDEALKGKSFRYPSVSHINPNPNGRIVGGTEATPNSFNFAVALTIDGIITCGGTLIAPDTVLTAAHCVDGSGIIAVTVGAHDRNHYEDTQLTLTTRNYILHENWDSSVVANDIALVRLGRSFSLNSAVGLATLAQVEPGVGSLVKAVGWGKTSDAAPTSSDILMEVEMPTVSDVDAEQAYGTEINFETILCTASVGGGTCAGDSGGPLIDSDNNLVGLTSFGASAGCEAGYPDCFTSVALYLDWIQSHL